jgi:aldehyde:ferredoxin oxidoreductase
MYGLMGKLLFVDLGNGTSEVRDLDETTARDYLGGPALGAKFIFEELPALTDAFAPESMLGFVAGALNGTAALMAGRYTVVSKSPVTNAWNDANSGGLFGPLLKKSGFDGIFFKGISEKPVYVFVDDGKVEIRDASHLWGQTVEATEEQIREEVGDPKAGVALIGPAGERKSFMANIMNDTHRTAGRGGSGAVMGSKNLKALVVRGSQVPLIFDKPAETELNKATMEWEKNGPVKPVVEGFGAFGTNGAWMDSLLSGDAGVKNWDGVALIDIPEEEQSPLSAPEMDQKYKRKKYACAVCPVGCGAIYSVEDEKYPIKETGRPEYETVGCFGSMCLNGDVPSINQCNYLCNEYGMDTISVGGTVAWLMECYSNGVFTAEELDGVELNWGNADGIVAITDKIAKGEGVGAILQHGSRYAAAYFGKGQESLVTASGIELPMHDSRRAPGLVRTYQYDPTPGRHVKGGIGVFDGNNPPEVKYNFDGSGAKDIAGVIEQEIVNLGGYCLFSGFGLAPGSYMGLINAVTGFAYSEEDQQNLGKRSYLIRHAFNLREGLRRKDWTLSDRAKGLPPMKEGPLAGVTIDGELLTDNFFAEIGFDADSVPTAETLDKIGGLETVKKDLYPEQ